jgi:hypothetical protein
VTDAGEQEHRSVRECESTLDISTLAPPIGARKLRDSCVRAHVAPTMAVLRRTSNHFAPVSTVAREMVNCGLER